MVRALYAGKWQTRRVVKLARWMERAGMSLDDVVSIDPGLGGGQYPKILKRDDDTVHRLYCTYGSIGDCLWVREGHRFFHEHGWIDGEQAEDGVDALVDQENVRYEADLRIGMRLDNERGGVVERITYLDAATRIELDNSLHSYRKRPSIHLPRWASRITLEITGVRVERLQNMSRGDAQAEGVRCRHCRGYDTKWGCMAGAEPPSGCCAEFARVWDEKNAKRGLGWEVNPLVWVIEFRRLTP